MNLKNFGSWRFMQDFTFAIKIGPIFTFTKIANRRQQLYQ